MVEIILTISNAVIVVAILVYFYLREIRNRQSVDEQLTKTQTFYEKISTSKDSLLKEINSSKDKLSNQNFTAFLKHIQQLEQMVLPKPITKQMVDDIMLRTPPLTENEIEKDAEEIDQDNFMEVLSKIPMDEFTNVSFENEIDRSDGPEEEVI